MTMNKILLIALLASILLVAGCTQKEAEDKKSNGLDQGGSDKKDISEDSDMGSGINNLPIADGTEGTKKIIEPSTSHCEDNGGVLIVEETEAGPINYCILEDGTKCEETAFESGDCPSEKSIDTELDEIEQELNQDSGFEDLIDQLDEFE